MKGRSLQLFFLFSIVNSSFLFEGCSKSTTGCVETGRSNLAAGQNGPRKIYVPAYYVYRNGKYQFVKGHYRWVLNRKAYLARANRGYTSKMDEASAR
jgi:hypothetical protein